MIKAVVLAGIGVLIGVAIWLARSSEAPGSAQLVRDRSAPLQEQKLLPEAQVPRQRKRLALHEMPVRTNARSHLDLAAAEHVEGSEDPQAIEDSLVMLLLRDSRHHINNSAIDHLEISPQHRQRALEISDWYNTEADRIYDTERRTGMITLDEFLEKIQELKKVRYDKEIEVLGEETASRLARVREHRYRRTNQTLVPTVEDAIREIDPGYEAAPEHTPQEADDGAAPRQYER